MAPYTPTEHSAAPPAPSRVRVIRPQFYRSALTGSLSPDVRDLLIALTTVADDEGWLLWSPDELAATLYVYASAPKRVRDLERRAGRLVEAGLLTLEECGCATLPSLKEHHGVKSGRQTAPIWGWHQRHSVGRGIPGHAGERPSSSSESSSESDSFEASSSSRAHDDAPDGASCGECGRPTSVHAVTCSQAPHLRVVSA